MSSRNIQAINAYDQARAPIERANRIFAKAADKFIAGERRRLGSDCPAWMPMAAMADSLGALLAMYAIVNRPEHASIREGVDTMFDLAKASAQNIIEWSERETP